MHLLSSRPSHIKQWNTTRRMNSTRCTARYPQTEENNPVAQRRVNSARHPRVSDLRFSKLHSELQNTNPISKKQVIACSISRPPPRGALHHNASHTVPRTPPSNKPQPSHHSQATHCSPEDKSDKILPEAQVLKSERCITPVLRNRTRRMTSTACTARYPQTAEKNPVP